MSLKKDAQDILAINMEKIVCKPSYPSNFFYQNQGILSVPGIAGYKWVPAKIGHFYKYKIFFVIPMAN